jgi:hypothetical protein
VEDARRLVALEQRLDEVRRGVGRPADLEERAQLARRVCRPKGLFAEAAELYARPIDGEVPELGPTELLDAASAAAAAGLGRGKDAPGDSTRRAELLERAQGWMRAELDACEELLRQDPKRAEAVAARLEAWTTDASIADLMSSSRPTGEGDGGSWAKLRRRLELLREPGLSR